jgi:hypothetical protein
MGVWQLNSSKAELTEAIKPFTLRNHPVQPGPVAMDFYSPVPCQGAYSTDMLLNRIYVFIYAQHRPWTVLLNTKVLNVDSTRPTSEIGAAEY